jgi:serine/threonine protein kinase
MRVSANAAHYPGYETLEVLGRGAFAEVFKAKQLSSGQLVALKVAHGVEWRHVAHESRVLAGLKHAHVVRLIASGSAIGAPECSVLEYLSGSTLRHLLRQHGALSLAGTLELMSQLLDALVFLHGHQIAHGDLKPENIILTPIKRFGATQRQAAKFKLTLIDFGHARDCSTPLTSTQYAATPAYSAPEQLRGESCVPASDVHAWALIFLECLSAKACFAGRTRQEVITQRLRMPVELPAALGRPLIHILQLALQPKAQQRETATVLQHKLIAFLQRDIRAEY